MPTLNPTVQAALVAGIVAIITSLLTQAVQAWLQAKKMASEYKTLDAAEAAIRHFLSLGDRPYRSFPMIQHYIGGFERNELRRMLVRSGAVRFMAADGTEMWALLDRVSGKFQLGGWKLGTAPTREGFEYTELFPAKFTNKDDY